MDGKGRAGAPAVVFHGEPVFRAAVFLETSAHRQTVCDEDHRKFETTPWLGWLFEIFRERKNKGNSSPALAALLPREGSTTLQLDTRSDRRRETDTPTTMASSSLRSVNPNAEIMSKAAALFMNINAAKGLQDVMKSNLGPKGTIKMLVGGAGGKEVEA